jgi:hypothetical protein
MSQQESISRLVELVIVSPDLVVFRPLLEHRRVLRLAFHLVAFRITPIARFHILDPHALWDSPRFYALLISFRSVQPIGSN